MAQIDLAGVVKCGVADAMENDLRIQICTLSLDEWKLTNDRSVKLFSVATIICR